MKNIQLLAGASLINLFFIVCIVNFGTSFRPKLDANSSVAAPSPSATTPLPTMSLTPSVITIISTPKPTDPPDTRCLITVDGSRYDVSEYRKLHSGGDIFVCGSNMTEIFYSQHGNKMLRRMEKYKI